MPDPQNTREWAPMVNDGGPDEINRVPSVVPSAQHAPTREFAPSAEGGPDELARGGEEFTKRVLEKREAAAELLVEKEKKREELLVALEGGSEPAEDVSDPVVNVGAAAEEAAESRD